MIKLFSLLGWLVVCGISLLATLLFLLSLPASHVPLAWLPVAAGVVLLCCSFWKSLDQNDEPPSSWLDKDQAP